MIHADYAKIKGVIEDAQDKYMDKGLIRDMVPKPRFRLPDGLEYTHIKEKPKINPIEEEKKEEEARIEKEKEE